jgi:adenylosuccinate lyase
MSPIKEIWTLEQQYKRWLEVEIAAVKACEEFEMAPKGISDKIRQNAYINVDEILEIESVVDHDVIAFIKGVTKNMGDEERYFHRGMTSSDVVDTALALGIKEAGEHILKSLEEFYEILKEKSASHKNTVNVARTHGIHGEPSSFGLKLLSFLAETERNIERFKKALDEVSQGKISGAVGNYANIDPEIEERALQILGLKCAKVSTQVVPRDVHAEFFSVLALIGASIERIAVEIRHLQKTEVLEAQEPFRKGQRGSSAMPHKKNPIICERLTGMARMLRSYAMTSYENIALWHERDISHSSVERVFFPDATMIAFYMIEKIKYVMKDLIVNEDRMKETFERSYNLVYSQRVMLGLIEKGISREESYKVVQECALKAWDERKGFKELLKNHPLIKEKISSDEIEDFFENTYYLRNIDKVYKRFDI